MALPDPQAAQAAREIAQAAREVEKEVRELYTHRTAKIKDVVHAPMVIMAILYPVVIGFTLQARGLHFSLTHPRPSGDDIIRFDRSGPMSDGFGPNQWVTFNVVVFIRTMLSFIGYTMVHSYVMTHMRMGVLGAYEIAWPYSWFASMFFFFVGLGYFYTYVSLSRYGVHLADWIAFGSFSFFLLLITLLVNLAPLCADNIIKDLEEENHND